MMHGIDTNPAERKSADGAAAPVYKVADWSARITERWQHTVEQTIKSFSEIGSLLIEAKAALPHGEFESMIQQQLPFKPSTARRLMAIARDCRISNRAHAHVLPPSWATLYELTKLDDDEFEARISDGTIRPDIER